MRGALVNAALAGAATAIAVAFAELAVRLLAPQQLIQVRPDIWEPADSLGWLNRPNLSTTINTGERTVHLYTDSNGLRIGAGGRRDAATRILLIGDSFMEALQVEYEQSFAGLLEARLPTLLARPIAVYNAGVDGWDPPQYLIRARQLLGLMHFDALVVALYLGNDIVRRRIDRLRPRTPAVHHYLRLPRRLTWHEFVYSVLAPLNDGLKTRSHLYILARTRLHTVLMRLGLTGEYFPEELLRSEATSARWDVTADICRDIAEEAARHGTTTLFLLVPTPFALDSATFDQARRGFGLRTDEVDLNQPTQRMTEALRARGLPFLDVLSDFRAASASGRQIYGSIDRHLTQEGHDLLTRLALPRLAASMGGQRQRSGLHE